MEWSAGVGRTNNMRCSGVVASVGGTSHMRCSDVVAGVGRTSSMRCNGVVRENNGKEGPTCISLQTSSSIAVQEDACCIGTIRQWPSVSDR